MRERIHSCLPGKDQQYQDFTPHHHPDLWIMLWELNCQMPPLTTLNEYVRRYYSLRNLHGREHSAEIEHALNLLLSIALGFFPNNGQLALQQRLKEGQCVWCVLSQSLQECLGKSLQLLCNPMDCSPPGFSAHGVSQARRLGWVAISSSGEIFSTQRLKPHFVYLLHWQADALQLRKKAGRRQHFQRLI